MRKNLVVSEDRKQKSTYKSWMRAGILVLSIFVLGVTGVAIAAKFHKVDQAKQTQPAPVSSVMTKIKVGSIEVTHFSPTKPTPHEIEEIKKSYTVKPLSAPIM